MISSIHSAERSYRITYCCMVLSSIFSAFRLHLTKPQDSSFFTFRPTSAHLSMQWKTHQQARYLTLEALNPLRSQSPTPNEETTHDACSPKCGSLWNRFRLVQELPAWDLWFWNCYSPICFQWSLKVYDHTVWNQNLKKKSSWPMAQKL